MKQLDFDMWFDRYGSDYGDYIEKWLLERPSGITLQSLNIYDMDDFINEKVLEAYEDYVSDFEDRAYENFKDGKCF